MIGQAASISGRGSGRVAAGTYRLGCRFGDERHAAPFTRSSMSSPMRGDAGGAVVGPVDAVRARLARDGVERGDQRGLVVGERHEVAAGHEVGERALVVVDVLAERWSGGARRWGGGPRPGPP